MSDLPVVGRTLIVAIGDDAKAARVPARVDTGAYTSSIWASQITEKDGELQFVLFDTQSHYYSGGVLTTRNYHTTEIISAFGDRQLRYVITLPIKLPEHGNQSVIASFTLADRSKKRYAVLLGRSFLGGRYAVDVQQSDEHDIKDEEFDIQQGQKT